MDRLLIACPRRIEREWPPAFAKCYPGLGTVLMTARAAVNTFKTIQFLSVEKPKDPWQKPEFVANVLPLARTLLEGVFNLYFMFGDLPNRSVAYVKSGWRDLFLETERQTARYSSDSRWTSYLKQRVAGLDVLRERYGVTADESSDPRKTIARWPRPSEMMRVDPERAGFISYLSDWFYKELSQVAHGHLAGLVLQSKILMGRDSVLLQGSDEEFADDLRILRSYSFGTSIVLMLALMSEIQIGLGFEPSLQLRYVWMVLSSYWPASREIFDERYGSLLK